MDNFDKAVLALIKEQRGNARFPAPITLEQNGRLTENAHFLGVAPGSPNQRTELDVFAAIKRLHAAGEVGFVHRYGYCWVVADLRLANQSELTDTPGRHFAWAWGADGKRAKDWAQV